MVVQEEVVDRVPPNDYFKGTKNESKDPKDNSKDK